MTMWHSELESTPFEIMNVNDYQNISDFSSQWLGGPFYLSDICPRTTLRQSNHFL